MGICDGRVVIVTGAARGLGRSHALAFAAEGAKVVVNDLGVELDGSGGGEGPAHDVVAEIEKGGGEAFANGADVADWDQTKALLDETVERFGGIDVILNNAGFVRDRMFATCGEDDWDATIRVHLKGHFCLARHASEYWRNQTKAGKPVDGRILNTSSGAGLQGSIGQSAYAAAKAGIAALTLNQAAEMGRYGVTSNAIAPSARTRMTEEAFKDMMAEVGEGAFDAMAPENVSPLLVWLGSAEARDVTGQVFEVEGGRLSVCDGWRTGPEIDKGAQWAPDEIGSGVHDLLKKAVPPQKVHGT